LIPDTVPLETEVLKEPENPEDDKGLDFGEMEFSFPCLPPLINEEPISLCLDMIVPPLDGGRLADEDDV
jgi:hypothetical protein